MSDDRLVFGFRYDRWLGLPLRLIGMGERAARVVVDDATVDVRMGWGFHARIPRSQIGHVAEAGRPFIGWGVHGWRGRWLVNGSMSGLVTVEIDPPVRARVLGFPVRLRTLYVSLADPDAFQAALADS